MPSNLPPTALPEDTVADNDPDRERFTDYHSHGTAVAALIASNGHLLAGVSQKTTLLAVKVHDRTRRNCISIYLEGVEYAANQGADVIHLSFPLEFSKEQYPGAVALVNRAMTYAHRKGAVLVAAAGNASENLDLDEDRFRFCMAVHVVCVSATGPALQSEIGTDAQDAPADYTNYGDAIDVAGPGGTGTFPVRIVPVWLACSQVTLITAANQAPSQCRVAPREIWWSTGTSFGAAATSGLLSLLVARIGEGKPDQVVAALRQSADDLGAEGDDPFYGRGRINVPRALGLPTP
jgi:serine protease